MEGMETRDLKRNTEVKIMEAEDTRKENIKTEITTTRTFKIKEDFLKKEGTARSNLEGEEVTKDLEGDLNTMIL